MCLVLILRYRFTANATEKQGFLGKSCALCVFIYIYRFMKSFKVLHNFASQVHFKNV